MVRKAGDWMIEETHLYYFWRKAFEDLLVFTFSFSVLVLDIGQAVGGCVT
jgi:hypothetical protein